MGTLGLALPWEARINSAAREREQRVDSSEGLTDRPHQTASLGSVSAGDSEIAALCRANNLAGYEQLYALHGTRMKNVARNLLGNVIDAEDAVQETFLKAQRSVASFRGQSSFVTWVYRILINSCYDARRSRVRKKEVTSDDQEDSSRPEPRAAGSHPSLRMALERALAALTKHQRDVFLLYEVEGFHHAEIANILEITETASKNTLFQAKKNLRSMLEPPRGATASGAR
ncbi:MAG TPA: RNA polymerase sigma factor [Candidatus Acidoferrum sp.]|nr:RNA polymerase sigma factor [Candidatus Acidoferrum sp.]